MDTYWGERDFNVLIFFDYDFIYGDKELVTIITETVLKNINNNQIFFAYLG
jgi:CBS domain-containing protein